jgi:hypothetical protein
LARGNWPRIAWGKGVHVSDEVLKKLGEGVKRKNEEDGRDLVGVDAKTK